MCQNYSVRRDYDSALPKVDGDVGVARIIEKAS